LYVKNCIKLMKILKKLDIGDDEWSKHPSSMHIAARVHIMHMMEKYRI